MFGFTKLTPKEIEERNIKLRIAELEEALTKETLARQASLVQSDKLRDELENLKGV